MSLSPNTVVGFPVSLSSATDGEKSARDPAVAMAAAEVIATARLMLMLLPIRAWRNAGITKMGNAAQSCTG